MEHIRVRELTYYYPQTTRPALDSASLTVNTGSFTAIIGPNDAGKSTLCYALTGYVPHFFHGRMTGSVQLAGKETAVQTLPELVTQAGLIFQKPSTQMSGMHQTVYAEVGFGLENLGLPRDEMKRRIDAALGMTGISRLAERHPHTLSGGEQQRVTLAAMVAMRPPLLVLDEPTAQLDPAGSRDLFRALQQLTGEGITLVIATHKLEWAAAFSDQMLLLHAGKIALRGTPQELLTHPELDQYGIPSLPYTRAAREGLAEKLWPIGMPLPITQAAAAKGFGGK